MNRRQNIAVHERKRQTRWGPGGRAELRAGVALGADLQGRNSADWVGLSTPQVFRDAGVLFSRERVFCAGRGETRRSARGGEERGQVSGSRPHARPGSDTNSLLAQGLALPFGDPALGDGDKRKITDCWVWGPTDTDSQHSVTRC